MIYGQLFLPNSVLLKKDNKTCILQDACATNQRVKRLWVIHLNSVYILFILQVSTFTSQTHLCTLRNNKVLFTYCVINTNPALTCEYMNRHPRCNHLSQWHEESATGVSGSLPIFHYTVLLPSYRVSLCSISPNNEIKTHPYAYTPHNLYSKYIRSN